MQKYVGLVDILDDKKAVEDFLRMEKWIFDSPDQAGEAFRQFVKQFYQANGFVNGGIDIGEREVHLGMVEMPVLNIFAEQDHLVPPAASKALQRAGRHATTTPSCRSAAATSASTCRVARRRKCRRRSTTGWRSAESTMRAWLAHRAHRSASPGRCRTRWLGLVAGLVGIAFGAHAHWSARECAIVFNRWPWGPGGAITLGNVILHTGDSLDAPCVTYAHRAGHAHEPAILLADHERAHVFQYMALGPLVPAAVSAVRRVSVRNRFERAADRYALTGRGWWPWAMNRPASTNGTPILTCA